jgi:hypothetical protein
VARDARNHAVAREPAIVEQLPPELDLFRRQRVLVRDRHVEIQPERNSQGCNEKQPDKRHFRFQISEFRFQIDFEGQIVA